MESIAPALPFVPIRVAGRDLKMCFDFGAVAKAETEIRKHDAGVYLLFAPWQLTLANLRALFAASLAVYQPAIGFDEAMTLVDWKSALPIAQAIQTAYADFMPTPKTDAPATQDVDAPPDPPAAPDQAQG